MTGVSVGDHTSLEGWSNSPKLVGWPHSTSCCSRFCTQKNRNKCPELPTFNINDIQIGWIYGWKRRPPFPPFRHICIEIIDGLKWEKASERRLKLKYWHRNWLSVIILIATLINYNHHYKQLRTEGDKCVVLTSFGVLWHSQERGGWLLRSDSGGGLCNPPQKIKIFDENEINRQLQMLFQLMVV